MNIFVVNARGGVPLKAMKYKVFYIGRGSPLGNMYSHLRVSTAKFRVKTRSDAVTMYAAKFDELLADDDEAARYYREIIDYYVRYGGIVLECFCRPKLCHGQIIGSRIASEVGSNKGGARHDRRPHQGR